MCIFYLREGARSLPDHPDNPQRDADHRGQGHEPADTVAPVRVGVHVVVLQRFVFNQEKQENSLQQKENNIKFVICYLHCGKELIKVTYFEVSMVLQQSTENVEARYVSFM